MGDKRKNTGDGDTPPAKGQPGLKTVAVPSPGVVEAPHLPVTVPGPAALEAVPTPGVVETPAVTAAEGDVMTLLESDVPKRVLHCDVCHDPLKPPVYQCPRMRHDCVGDDDDDYYYECSSCTAMAAPAVFVQRSYLDALFSNTKVACPYKKHGCASSSAFRDAADHAAACVYAPCVCPECPFEGTPADLVRHLTEESGGHRWTAHKITYGKGHRYALDELNLEKNHCQKLLVAEEDDGVFLLDISHRHDDYHLVNLVCVRNNAGAVSVYSSSVAVEGSSAKGLTVKVETKVVASCPAPAELECEVYEDLLVHPGLLQGKQSNKIHLGICISKNQDLST